MSQYPNYSEDFYDRMMLKWEGEPNWIETRGKAENRMINEMQDTKEYDPRYLSDLAPPKSDPRAEVEYPEGYEYWEEEERPKPVKTDWSREISRLANQKLREQMDNMPIAQPKKPVDNNPKTLAAASKPRLSNVPTVALYALAAAMDNGAEKYGRFNWRDTSVTASVFADAIDRHHTDYKDGLNFADDSKVHHLAHIMACCAIQLDAIFHGVYNDDRDLKHSTGTSILTAKPWTL